jgi:hypothetical protein
VRYKAGQMVDVWEVRNELCGLRNQVIEWSNNHLLSMPPADRVVHGKSTCTICVRNAAQRQGVEMAIRHFGGRP